MGHPPQDARIAWRGPVPSPAALRRRLPLPATGKRRVAGGRRALRAILEGRDDRLAVVVGPCSVHDPIATLDYAARLAAAGRHLGDALCLVMRAYVEKPRTALGWKGLVNDPRMDGSFLVEEGLRTARRLLIDLVATGLAVGCEFLEPFAPPYLADAVSWGALGARTVESQVHRQLVSGLAMPVGVKNSTDGNVQVAVDALRTAGAPHVGIGIADDGSAAVMATTGNPDTHLVLRGAREDTNYGEPAVQEALALLSSAGLPERVMIDASHGNSRRDHHHQPVVARQLARRRAAGQRAVVGVLLESFLVSGRQDPEPGHPERLTYGQSVTDACLGWEATLDVLTELAGAVRSARRRPSPLRRSSGATATA